MDLCIDLRLSNITPTPVRPGLSPFVRHYSRSTPILTLLLPLESCTVLTFLTHPTASHLHRLLVQTSTVSLTVSVKGASRHVLYIGLPRSPKTTQLMNLSSSRVPTTPFSQFMSPSKHITLPDDLTCETQGHGAYRTGTGGFWTGLPPDSSHLKMLEKLPVNLSLKLSVFIF